VIHNRSVSADILEVDAHEHNIKLSILSRFVLNRFVATGSIYGINDADMSTNAIIITKKSNCLRIGPRHDRACVNITTENGCQLQWVDEIRYLGVFIVRSTKFKCSANNAKRSNGAANGIFGKIGQLASEEVIVQLLLHKRMPILLYGFEVCVLDKRSLQSVDFTVNRFL